MSKCNGIIGAIDTNEYDIIWLDESLSFEDVKALGICTHSGFRIPNQNDIVEVLKMFPNLERVDYNVIDSRLKDQVYWPAKVSDLENSGLWLEFKKIYPKDTYLSKIPLVDGVAGNIFEDILLKYESVFNEMARKDTPITFGENFERGEHNSLDDNVLRLLKDRASYRNEKRYGDANDAKDKLISHGIEIMSENKIGTPIAVTIKDHSKTYELKNNFFEVLQNAYESSKELSLAEFQAAIHEAVFKDTLQEYAMKFGRNIAFGKVNFISEDKLNHPLYNHVLEDHNGQQVVLLPVLQGARNGDVQRHKEYIIEKYIKAHEKNDGVHDIPRMIITPKKFRSIFSM